MAAAETFSFRPFLISPIFFGSRFRFAILIDPKLLLFQASFFGYRFRDGPQPKMGVQFRI